MSKPGWQSKLSRPISLKTGTKLETLADARAFILDISRNPITTAVHGSTRQSC